jgi:hypothetical protein
MSGRPPSWIAPLAPQRVWNANTIEGRVALIAEAARVLSDSRTPAGAFVGSALAQWLEEGGDLARDFLRVVRPKSHRTAAAIWRELVAEREPPHTDEGADRESGKESPSSEPEN